MYPPSLASSETASSGHKRASREEAGFSGGRKAAYQGRRSRRRKLYLFVVTLIAVVPGWTFIKDSFLSPISLLAVQEPGAASITVEQELPSPSPLRHKDVGVSAEATTVKRSHAPTSNSLLRRLQVVMSRAASTIQEEGEERELGSLSERREVPSAGDINSGAASHQESLLATLQPVGTSSQRDNPERMLLSRDPGKRTGLSVKEPTDNQDRSLLSERGSSEEGAEDVNPEKQEQDKQLLASDREGSNSRGNREPKHPRWSRRMMVLPYSEDYEASDVSEARHSLSWAEKEAKREKKRKRRGVAALRKETRRFIQVPQHQSVTNQTGEGAPGAASLSPLTQVTKAGQTEAGLVIAITPTYVRAYQALHITNLVNALRAAQGPLVWIVVEAPFRTQETADLLQRTAGQCVQGSNLKCHRIDYVHLETGKRETSIFNKGVVQRNCALEYIEQQRIQGTVYFMDDDNTYSPALVGELRRVRQVGVFPVGFLFSEEQTLAHPRRHTAPLMERPLVRAGEGGVLHVFGWETFQWSIPGNTGGMHRPFCTDLAGFAFRLLGSNFLERLVPDLSFLEPLASNCTEVLVWQSHAEAEPRSPFPWNWRLMQPKSLVPVEHDRATWPYVIGGKRHGLKGQRDDPESLGYKTAECSSWSLCWIGLRFR